MPRMHIQERGALHNEVSSLLFRYQFFTRIFSCVGLFLLFTTLFSPFWLTVIQSKTPINVGLWNICKDHTCQKLVAKTKSLHLIRSLMSLSTISGLIAVACVLITKPSLKNSNWPLFTNLFTGILALITMVLYGLSLKFKTLFGHPVPDTTEPIYISWCFVMGCFASFLFLLNGLLFILIAIEEDSTTHFYIRERKNLDETT
ncbi:uncharacterized protein LOC117669273 isoform X2 [Pantherophis guttatus]|uniref:Uncharacterized protein LOC117669273 isoform X2 n=1 Tax=Pantherophis guttatus TaxID=94885 RepID=A0A6P9C5K3_PANGU|nr:uncharacterized protein LOC117669273 isoform X2 [Pantherophis guttatus]